MMKSIILDPTGSSIIVETKFRDIAEAKTLEKHQYYTKFELTKKYGNSPSARAFVKNLMASQEGIPHPQDSSIRMYKILNELSTSTGSKKSLESTTSARGTVSGEQSRKLLAEKVEAGMSRSH
jgi:hypothetical protein